MATSTLNVIPDVPISSQPVGTCFSKVLLATDFSRSSRPAFGLALDIGRLFRAQLTLLHVFEYADVVTSAEGAEMVQLQRLLQDAQVSLHKLNRDAQAAGVHSQMAIRGGVPPEAILNFLEEEGSDLVVLGTSALHGFERLLFGSTAEGVMRKAKVPVLTIGPRAHDHAMTEPGCPVVFATDFNGATAGAVTLASGIARRLETPLHCIHVLPRALETGSHTEALPQILAEALEHVTARCDGQSTQEAVCTTVFGSEVSNAIVEYAREQRAGLIVLGVRQASMAASHGPLHIASRIVREAPCPVLTIAFDSSIESHLVAATMCCA